MFEKTIVVAGIAILAFVSINLTQDNALLKEANAELEQRVTVLTNSYDEVLEKHKALYAENLKLQEEINNAICENKDWSNTPIPDAVRNSVARLLDTSNSSSNSEGNKNK